MRYYSIIAFVVVLSVTSAQYPTCAQPCIDSAIKSTTTCAIDDLACVCANGSKLSTAATPCVISSCSSGDALGTQRIAGEICENLDSSSALPSTTSSEASSSSVSPNSSSLTSKLSEVAPTSSTLPTSASASAAAPSTSNGASHIGTRAGSLIVLGIMALEML